MSAAYHVDQFLEDDDHEHGVWSDLSRAADDLRKLANFVRSILPTISVDCSCANGGCDLCEVERILAENAQRRDVPAAHRTVEMLAPPPF